MQQRLIETIEGWDVDVSDEDIKDGQPGNPGACPIACAIRTDDLAGPEANAIEVQGGGWVSWMQDEWRGRSGNLGFRVYLSGETSFISCFDQNGAAAVEPVTLRAEQVFVYKIG